MLRVHLICIGSLKERYFKEACAEYEKRLRPFCKLQITELAEQRLFDDAGEAEISAVVQAEGRRILEKADPRSLLIPLCIEGRQLDSPGLSDLFAQAALDGYSTLTLVIGGSYGLSDEVKRAGKFGLSMSRLTFPHQLARVVLLEQVYRAFMISSHAKYHK